MSIKTVQAIINGQAQNLTYNGDTGKYEATLTAPADSSFPLEGKYYPVQIKADDTAGNSTTVDSTHSTLGESLKLYVKEQVKPVITILEPSSGAYVTESRPKIRFTVSDISNGQSSGYSGIDTESFVLKINGRQVNEEDIEQGSFVSTPQTDDKGIVKEITLEAKPNFDLDDGDCTITIDAADNDGNAAETASCTFKVDTLAPSLTIDNPVDNYETNKASLTVSGTTTDATSKPVTVKISVNGADQGEITVSETGQFSKEITLNQKNNTIIVTATDSAGKSTSVTRTVIYNTTAPKIISVNISPNPAFAGKTYTISVEVE